MHLALIVVAAIAGSAIGACSPPSMPSNIRLEARDTIVELGRYRVLFPRSIACVWILHGSSEPPEASIWFRGCGDMGYSVTTGVSLYDGIDRLDKERRAQFLAASWVPVNNRDCNLRRLREASIGSKYWVLCEGSPPVSGAGGGQYNLNVIIQEKEYYFIFKCEMDPIYFALLEDTGEIERFVNAVQVWE